MSRARLSVSRRTALGWLGGSVALSPLVIRGAVQAAPAVHAPKGADRGAPDIGGLFGGLAPGQLLSGFVVEAIQPPREGAAVVRLRSGDGHVFELEVLARDGGHALTPKPPAFTKLFSVYVKNGGDGWLPTVEAQGLCAMALSKVIADNEREPHLQGFLTYTERLEKHRASLLPGTPSLL